MSENYLDCEIVYLADGTKLRAIETQDKQAGYYYAGPFRICFCRKRPFAYSFSGCYFCDVDNEYG